MDTSIGFIGIGNMGGALARAAVRKLGSSCIQVCGKDPMKTAERAVALGCRTATAASIAAGCRYIFLGVKPQNMPEVLKEIAPVLSLRGDRFLLVTMAAGLSISQIAEMVGGKYPTIRIMPNMPAAVGEGMTLFACCPVITAEEKAEFLDLMSCSGKLEELPEKLIDAGSALSGCGPAFVFMFAQALADGAVACGLARDTAQRLALQTLLGSAKLALEDGRHPEALKDAVCSPGGSTIEGAAALEEGAFRALCMKAVRAAYDKTLALGNTK